MKARACRAGMSRIGSFTPELPSPPFQSGDNLLPNVSAGILDKLNNKANDCTFEGAAPSSLKGVEGKTRELAGLTPGLIGTEPAEEEGVAVAGLPKGLIEIELAEEWGVELAGLTPELIEAELSGE